MNNCFSILTRSDLNGIRKETIKKRLVWLTGEFMREHEAVNSGCPKFRSLQYLQTWQKANHRFNLFVSSFVSFSINGLKENAENLNYYPILRRKVELYLFLSTHRKWESFLCRFLQMLSTAATIKVSVVYLQSSLPCQLAGTYSFRKYLPSSFLHKLTSIYRQNWSCEKIPKSQNSD